MLEEGVTTNDARIKEKLISDIRSMRCGSVSDRTVCCDIDNGKYQIWFFFPLIN